MSEIPEDTSSHAYASFVYGAMKRQAALGLRVAAVFVVLIVGLPLFNMYFPKLAATPVMGFTVTWLFLGVAFFPITWLLSAYFVRESDRIESEAARAALGSTAMQADTQTETPAQAIGTDEDDK